MPSHARCPGKTALASALTIAFSACLMQGAIAQETSPSLYALNQKGLVTVNATTLETLKGGKWVDIIVDGSDRWTLRNDGRVEMNGVQQYKIKCKDQNNKNVDEGTWVGMAMRDGVIWALSSKGYLAMGENCAAQLDPGDFYFTDIFAGTTDGSENTWALRSDGALYVNTISGAIFQLEGGDGIDPESGEGEASDTEWMSGAVRPSDGLIFGMRRDGVIVAGTFFGGDGTPFSGTMVASLPFGNTANSGTLYADLAFTEDDNWLAIRGNGQCYNPNNTLNSFVDFNGGSSGGQAFVDLLPLPADLMDKTVTDMSFFALRRDGKLFRETSESAVASLPKSSYGTLALSLDVPDLTNHKNALPVVTVYNIQAVTGTPYSFPIIATDTDTADDDLNITVDAETLPENATYDPMTRTVSCDSPVKGKAKIKVTVDDGGGKAVKKTFKVVVRDPPKNPDKQVKPRASKIKGAQALVGFQFDLPILASDQNGDEITITADETKPPFTLGATFDPETNVFSWTDADLGSIGNYTLQFTVSDGTKQSKLKVKLKMVSSLLGF